MSREQDLLFCKIAITSKMVSQEDAQKCLAIANRFEAEGKRRPHVGQIFLKRNLLSDQDVLRIYGAIKKRLEAGGPSPSSAQSVRIRGTGPAAAPRAVRAPAARAAAGGNGQGARPIRVVRSRTPPREGIDPTTLWRGIIFAAVALGCIIAMFFLVFFRGEPQVAPDSHVGIPPKAPAAAPAASPLSPAPRVPSASLPGAEKTPAKSLSQ